MKVYAISDIHLDYNENMQWLNSISSNDYKNDIIILAGDISHDLKIIKEAFKILSIRFKEVFFVAGNHDLWVSHKSSVDSITKLEELKLIANSYGIHMKPYSFEGLSIVPLFSWYDYSFGKPSIELISSWRDYTACRWRGNNDVYEINQYFISMNSEFLNIENEMIISFSHFLPDIGLMPSYIPQHKRFIYPVLGSTLLMKDIKKLGSSIHIYGHSHVNTSVRKEGTLFINNAYGYPYEKSITSKKLKCIYEK